MLGRGGMYKKSFVDELIGSTPNNYELKFDLNPVRNLTETESETKIDLDSVKPPVIVSPVELAKMTDMLLSTQKVQCDEVKFEMDPTNDEFSMTPDSSRSESYWWR